MKQYLVRLETNHEAEGIRVKAGCYRSAFYKALGYRNPRVIETHQGQQVMEITWGYNVAPGTPGWSARYIVTEASAGECLSWTEVEA
jgi:hypothetical protein